MAADPTIYVRIVLKNRRSVREFMRAVELVEEAAADHPWRSDIQRALQLLKRCGRSLTPRNKRRR